MVTSNINSIGAFADLRNYVYTTLCGDHELLSDAFPTSESILRRSNGEICGAIFCIRGPRSVDFSAIWETAANRVLFYDPTGRRYRQTNIDPAVDANALAREAETVAAGNNAKIL
ncbi:MAG: hypothetical protein HUK22_03870 [Thermoguttaceae bacterium]|nr:hypothetical protein [Thermoguttaceae bacterium]